MTEFIKHEITISKEEACTVIKEWLDTGIFINYNQYERKKELIREIEQEIEAEKIKSDN